MYYVSQLVLGLMVIEVCSGLSEFLVLLVVLVVIVSSACLVSMVNMISMVKSVSTIRVIIRSRADRIGTYKY